VRRIATDLRPALLDDFGLAAAIEWQVQEFSKRSGLACTFDNQMAELEWDAAASTGVFRALQESLTNIARHAAAATATVRIGYRPDALAVRVDDDGKAMPGTAPVPGVGLLGMRERVTALGGHLRAEPRSEGGFTVQAELPMVRTP